MQFRTSSLLAILVVAIIGVISAEALQVTKETVPGV
jgi:hypothetical protein